MGRRRPKEVKGTAPPAEFDERSSALLLAAEMGGNVSEIDLHGMDSHDAEMKVDELIDGAFMAGTRVVRIIHGDGRGILRKVVRDHLANHELVAAWRPAPGPQGAGVAHAVIEKKI